MRPFPTADRLAFLVGNELSNITLQPYSIDFRFVEGPLLVVEHGLEYVDLDGQTHAHDPQNRLGPAPLRFHALIGDRVARVASSGFRLALTFASGRKLIVISKDGPYESGHIGRSAYDERGVLRDQEMIIF